MGRLMAIAGRKGAQDARRGKIGPGGFNINGRTGGGVVIGTADML